MGFDRFTRGLFWRLALLIIALIAFAAALLTPNLGAARIVAGLLVAGAGWMLWQHVSHTNFEIARFVEALRMGDYSAHFDRASGSGFDMLGKAFDGAIRKLREERRIAGDEMRFLEALVDDMPVALLTIEAGGRVEAGNKAARRLFTRHEGVRAGDFAIYGATFARRLELDAPDGEEVLILNLDGRAKRAIVRTATLARLGGRSRAVVVQPIQDTLNAVEMAAQTDLVRVLTHEILNSLTPVISLASTAEHLLAGDDDGARADARIAVSTLERRAQGLMRFIESYRLVAREPKVDRRRFEASPFADELARLFDADWPNVTLELSVEPDSLVLDADPDLLAQVLINLLRNAGEAASSHGDAPRVSLSIGRLASGEISIAVGDNGPGVPEELRRDVFLPFFTTRRHGTGVGLNLARQIVVAHGGTIEIERDELGGARFLIVI